MTPLLALGLTLALFAGISLLWGLFYGLGALFGWIETRFGPRWSTAAVTAVLFVVVFVFILAAGS